MQESVNHAQRRTAPTASQSDEVYRDLGRHRRAFTPPPPLRPRPTLVLRPGVVLDSGEVVTEQGYYALACHAAACERYEREAASKLEKGGRR